MSQNFLRRPLVDPVANAKHLPSLPERVEVNNATKIIRVRDARSLQIRAQALVRWESAEEHTICVGLLVKLRSPAIRAEFAR
jgi:hypothetical protein